MTIPCKHWQDCGIKGGGCCTINAYKRPSFGVCLKVCDQYDGPDRAPLLAQLKAKPHGCCGKTKPPVVVWAWVRWYGLPYPIRLWRWVCWASRPHPRIWPGCGCLVKLRAALVAVKTAYTSIRRA